jgi:hypothetical protein
MSRWQRLELRDPVKSFVTIFIALAAIGTARAFAADKDSGFEGTISATLTRDGTEPIHFLFTRKSNQLRIVNTTNKLEPINILDLEARKLVIVFPHNTTFVRVDLAKSEAQAERQPMPPNFPTPPAIDAPPSGALPGRAGPQPSPLPNFPSPPPMPSMPAVPSGGPPALPMPMMPPSGYGAPGMPPMPAMPGAFGVLELQKTDKTKTIQGFDCTLYTLSDRGENFEIWATDDTAFFPFRLLQRDSMSRHFGPRMLEEQWPELLQKKSLFPLEATLRMEPNGQERLSFKVDKIDNKSIDDPDALFSPPKDFYEIQMPQF